MTQLIIKNGPDTKEYNVNNSLTTQDLETINSLESFMSTRITKYNRDALEYLFTNIQNAKNIYDLIKINIDFTKLYIKSEKNSENITKYQKMLKEQGQLSYKETIKEIVQRHLFNKLVKLDRGTSYINISRLESLKYEGIPASELFKIANINIKENTDIPEIQTLIEKSFLDIIDLVYYKKVTNLCFDCKNGHPGNGEEPNTCTKINMPKEHISKYQFIERGQQLIKNDGEQEKFIVEKCKNYVLEPNSGPYVRKRS